MRSSTSPLTGFLWIEIWGLFGQSADRQLMWAWDEKAGLHSAGHLSREDPFVDVQTAQLAPQLWTSVQVRPNAFECAIGRQLSGTTGITGNDVAGWSADADVRGLPSTQSPSGAHVEGVGSTHGVES